MPTAKQLQRRQAQNITAATGGGAAENTQYFWEGYGETDTIGIVKAADGSFHRGSISGNEMPGKGARVAFVPGNPLGQIQLQTVGGPAPQAAAAVPGGAGTPLQYYAGDPNFNSVTPITGRLFDTFAEREFIPSQDGFSWVPAAKIMFVYEGPIGQQYYPGDSYWGSDSCLQVYTGATWENSGCTETGGPLGDGAFCGPPWTP
jgi:hypothetical protein